MKKLLLQVMLLLFALSSFGQIAYLQYRNVPLDRQGEFVEKETKYWAKVAKKAIDQGKMTSWSLWRKVGVTEEGAPNYVFVNTFESIESLDLESVWSDENIKSMGVNPEMVETNSFAPTTFDYWVQLEDQVEGDYKYAVVNYAMPTSRGDFIEENKSLWKPLHNQNIKNGTFGMTAWGMLSVIHPIGVEGRFSVLTYDGFNKMSDVLNYLRYSNPDDNNEAFNEVISKSKMNEIMPNGFQYRIVYELVKRVAAE